MDDRSEIAWLHRRVGFGLRPGQLDDLAAKGTDAALDALLEPGAAGTPVAPDPWADVDFSGYEPGGTGARAYQRKAIGAWLVAMVETPRPFEEWMRWFWHGHFVSTLRVVKYPQAMVQQLRTLGALGLGDFRTLLRAVTVDPAMLVYLDGRTNTKGAVNENYGREVLELFSLGVGAYGEDDVRAGAEALTGWTVGKATLSDGGPAIFRPRAHDDAPKTYLGREGVHDVDSVIDAIVGHPACAPHLTGKLCRAILGPDVGPDVIGRLATDFAASGLQVRPLVRAILTAGLREGASRDLVLSPVPWSVAMIKATGAPAVDAVPALATGGLVAAGQVPMDAPNVSGWPGARAWLSSSATVARFDLAGEIGAVAPSDSAVRIAAQRGDLAALAAGLGHPEGFGAATAAALGGLRDADRTGDAVLQIALAAPEAVLA